MEETLTKTIPFLQQRLPFCLSVKVIIFFNEMFHYNIQEFENDLKKNNIRSVLEQIRDTSELDPEVPLSDLQSLEKRWEVLNAWAGKRKIFLQATLDKWRAFRQEELALVEWIDAKDARLQELDTPINLTDENAVQERVQTLRVSVGNDP